MTRAEYCEQWGIGRGKLSHILHDFKLKFPRDIELIDQRLDEYTKKQEHNERQQSASHIRQYYADFLDG